MITTANLSGEPAAAHTDGGAAWQMHSFAFGEPNEVGELNVVACTSTRDCIGEGDGTSAVPQFTAAQIATSSNGGASWQVRVEKVPGNLWSLSCPTSVVCVSVGEGYTYDAKAAPGHQYTFWGAVERTLDGGRTWQLTKLRPVSLQSVSCVSHTSECVAVGSTSPGVAVIFRSLNYGVTWTAEPLPSHP